MNDLEKLISNLSTYWDITPEQVVDRLNFMNESEINKVVDKMKQKFKNGGVIDCLRKGGKTYSECVQCGGKVVKNQEPAGPLRARGSVTAYRGDDRPEFTADSTWTHNNGAWVKNMFDRNTLEQHVVTDGQWGTPRRVIRTITNYNIPSQSDTTYTDANGKKAGRNSSAIREFFNMNHSDKWMDSIDAILKGMEPYQLSEKEVKATEKKQEGGKVKKSLPNPPSKKRNSSDLLKNKKK